MIGKTALCATDKRLPYYAVNNRAHRVWDELGLIHFLVNDQAFSFFQLVNNAHREMRLNRGPFLFSGKMLVLQAWHIGIKLHKDVVKKIPVWAHLHNLPVQYLTEEGLSYAASAISFITFMLTPRQRRGEEEPMRQCVLR